MTAAIEDEAQLGGSKVLITISAMLAGLLAFVDISIVTVALVVSRAVNILPVHA